MDEIKKSQICQEMGLKKNDNSLQWLCMEPKDDVCICDFMESEIDDSLESSSSTEMIEDASSSTTSSSSSTASSSCSPLFNLSDLMAQLPIKRGLSKFYQGKSESFASLTSVNSFADLAKKEKYCCRSRSSMKSYSQGQNQRLSPKVTIAKNKKGSSSSTTIKTSIFSSMGKISSLMAS